jgi:hypothetical protein
MRLAAHFHEQPAGTTENSEEGLAVCRGGRRNNKNGAGRGTVWVLGWGSRGEKVSCCWAAMVSNSRGLATLDASRGRPRIRAMAQHLQRERAEGGRCSGERAQGVLDAMASRWCGRAGGVLAMEGLLAAMDKGAEEVAAKRRSRASA